MDKIRVVTIKVTDFCNFNCSYCFENEETKNHLTVFNKENDLLEFLKQFEYEDTVKIQLFGGEVFTECKKIESIINTIKKLERCKDTILKFGFITNGSLVKNIISLIKEDYFTIENCKISYDGLCSHYTRGLKYNQYDPLFSIHMNDTLKELAPYCQDALISMAVTKDNIKTLFHTYRYLEELGYKNFEYYFLFGPSMVQYDWNFAQCLHNELVRIMEKYDYYQIRLHNYELYKGTYNYADCDALGSQFYIDTNGDVYICGLLAEMQDMQVDFNETTAVYNISDIYNDSKEKLESILNDSKTFADYIKFMTKEFCQDKMDCQYRDFCNTCPLVRMVFKSAFKDKIYCPLKMIREAEHAAFIVKEKMIK